ncbi:MAG: asparagine synthase (glutamine-hydrolyzing) [Patescibacteria group bacterium]|nr:asparagine synthase (glutamine-hydrolyzing) [Patescibacteria group bacterium]
MCGIAGYFGQGSQEILKKMTGALRHRGPDDEGFYVDNNVGLGHRRLSIIDLSAGGHQPMSSHDGNIWLVFNGEIYNFKELRAGLENRGHKFKSHSDTEVILSAYEEYGGQCFEYFNGMFAVALYDARNKKLILARDRMGKKPLYWGIFNNTLVFASELKALLKHPRVSAELDLSSLNKYLLHEYVPTPHSILQGIKKLEPGHYLEYDGRAVKKKKFWDITFQSSITSASWRNQLRIEEAVAELDNIINQAVKSRLMSDVPLGIFLSGGIDSSTIAYYAQKNSARKIKTFSIGFKEGSFNESGYARRAANFLGTEHYEKILSADDSLKLIPKIADLLDEPMADASIIPTYLLSEFTKQAVTVALGGDGGDELFCGYDTFIAHKIAAIYDKIPLAVRKKIIEKIALSLPTSFNNISFDFKAKKFIDGFYGKKEYRHQRWLGAFNKNQREKLFLPEVWGELKDQNEFIEIDNYLVNLKEESYFNQMIYLYLRMYLMDDILVKVDRASMFNSLEVRAPLLDYRVVDFVNSLPLDFKINGFKTKHILKRLMADKLPKEIIYRPKKGFGLPLAAWLTKELKPLVVDLLSETRIKKRGLFNYQYINQLLEDHFSRRADNRKLIWTLMVFQMWREKWSI